MISSTKTTRRGSLLGRLFVILAMGLLMLSLGAASAFASNGTQGSSATANHPVISTGGGVSLDADCDDDDDEDDCENGGGGLPATDTASDLSVDGQTGTPVAPILVLMLAGVVIGAAKVAAKRPI